MNLKQDAQQVESLLAHNQLLHGLIGHLIPNYNPQEIHNLHQQVIDGMRGAAGMAGGPLAAGLANKAIGGVYNALPTNRMFLNVDPAQFGYPPDNTVQPSNALTYPEQRQQAMNQTPPPGQQYQGPVPSGYNLPLFRQTGRTVPLNTPNPQPSGTSPLPR